MLFGFGIIFYLFSYSRNPFFFPEEKKVSVEIGYKFSLQGIVINDDKKRIIIEDNNGLYFTLKEGDFFGDINITKIERKKIIIKNKKLDLKEIYL